MNREEAIEILKQDIPCEHDFDLIDAINMAIQALEQEPCIQEKQANADKIDAVYIDGFKAGYSQARFDLEQEPCDNVCERFEQYVDIATDIVEFRFSDGTVKRAKRGLYMRDIEKSIRKMLIDQMANEKNQEPCGDAISRQAVLDAVENEQKKIMRSDWAIDQAKFSAMSEIMELIEDLPSVSTEKVGRWLETEVMQSGYKETWIKCNNCGYDTALLIPKKYCPNCGAKMEVEE